MRCSTGVAAGLDHVQISIQAPEAELADRIAGTVVHEKKLEVLERVRQRDVALTLNCVLHRLNHDAIEEIIALAERLEFGGWSWPTCSSTDGRIVTASRSCRRANKFVTARRSLMQHANDCGQDGNHLRVARLFRRFSETVHEWLGQQVYNGHAQRPGFALSGRGGDSER